MVRSSSSGKRFSGGPQRAARFEFGAQHVELAVFRQLGVVFRNARRLKQRRHRRAGQLAVLAQVQAHQMLPEGARHRQQRRQELVGAAGLSVLAQPLIERF